MTRTQIKHLLYKEWLKTRWFAAVSLLLGIILSTYACIDALSSFHSLGGAFFYSTLLSGNISLMGQLKYLPLGVALLIGCRNSCPKSPTNAYASPYTFPSAGRLPSIR